LRNMDFNSSAYCFFVLEFFCSTENPHHEVLTQVLKRLQGDNDRDVRYFASLCPSSTDIEEVCNHKVKVSRNRPRWPKGFRVG
jgi:hypothetical protein